MARLNVELSGRASEVLEELAGKYGKSKTEMLRMALALLIAAEKAEEGGGALAITKDGRVEKELVLVR